MIDIYQKGWAQRYIREAKAELTACRIAPRIALNLILDAVRKAQAAVYHILGEPVSIESTVQQIISRNDPVKDPVLRCLVEIEKTVQRIAGLPPSNDKTLKEADNIVQVATEIVNLFVSED